MKLGKDQGIMKRLFTSALVILILFALGCSFMNTPAPSKSEEMQDVFSEGIDAGSNDKRNPDIVTQQDTRVYWTYDQKNRVLAIHGKGPMPDPVNIESDRPYKMFANEIEKVIVNDGITRICDGAFYGLSQLKDVELPNSIESIGVNAFDHTPWYDALSPDEHNNIVFKHFLLGSIEPSGVIVIPDDVVCVADDVGKGTTSWNYQSCYSTQYVAEHNKRFVTEDGVLFSADKTIIISFPSQKNVSNYCVPDTVKTIGNFCFSGNNSIIAVELPESVEEIRRGAFSNCHALSSITSPNNLRRIDAYAFCETGIKSFAFPGSVNYIGSYAFAYSNLQSVVLPEQITCVEEGTFEWCNNLSEITLPNGIRAIQANAFAGCPILEIQFPETLEYITYNSFGERGSDRCQLNYTTDGNGAYIINGRVLVGGDSGTTVNPAINHYTQYGSLIIPENISCVMQGWRKPDAYDASLNPRYSTIQGSLYSADGKILISVSKNQSFLNVPEGVMTIRPYVCMGCNQLESIILPKSLNKIEPFAFFMSSIRQITISNTVTEIGRFAFDGADALTDIYFDGTQEEWEKIYISSGNDPVLKSTVHFSDGSVQLGYQSNSSSNESAKISDN